MARIVQGPDDCAYYPRDDHDDVDVDSDSKDVFGVENTHIKCSLHEDYYVPVVTAEIVEPHIGMILEVSNRPDAIENDYDDDDGGSGGDTKEKDSTTTKINNKIRYQLTQPMDLDNRETCRRLCIHSSAIGTCRAHCCGDATKAKRAAAETRTA
jgi:hypothetical protein